MIEGTRRGEPISAALAEMAMRRPARRRREAETIMRCLVVLHLSVRTLAELWRQSSSQMARICSAEADAPRNMVAWLERKEAEWRADPPPGEAEFYPPPPAAAAPPAEGA